MPIKVTSKECTPEKQKIIYPRLRQFNTSRSVWLETRQNNGFYLDGDNVGKVVKDDFSRHSAFNSIVILENE